MGRVEIVRDVFSDATLKGERDRVGKIFRILVGRDFAKCGVSDLAKEILGDKCSTGYFMGTDGNLSDSYLLDAFAIVLYTKDTSVVAVTDRGLREMKNSGFLDVTRGTIEDAEIVMNREVYGVDEDDEGQSDWDVQEDEVTSEDSYFGDTEEVDVEDGLGDSIKEESEEVESEDFDVVKEDDTNKEVIEDSNNDRSSSDEEIGAFYKDYYSSVIKNLKARYSSLFASSYELIPLSGLLMENGMARLSGNKVAFKNSASLQSIYNIFKSKLNIAELGVRSNRNIANVVYNNYVSGKRNLYFPYKLLEFAYGRSVPTGNDQESQNTYTKHALCKNWSEYSEKEVKGSLGAVFKEATITFIKKMFTKEEYFSMKANASLRDFLGYLERSLSNCVEVVEWKTTVDGEVVSFAIRFTDLDNSVSEAITAEVIQKGFLGSVGESPYSKRMLNNIETCVKEIGHEFNHAKAQAEPLFAYKALMTLREQGIEPSVENMLLGKAEDGTIMKNGSKGVGINYNLTHYMTAGSRAGKGVMTLNMLASGIYSGKAIFYLDDKPDMASALQHMCPDMFVVNGEKTDPKFDDYGYFRGISQRVNWDNVPDYVSDAFNIGRLSKSWSNSYGNLFYFRALKLVIGIIAARAKGASSLEVLNSDKGVMLVADEFTVFTETFNNLFNSALGNLPPVSFESDSQKLLDENIKPAVYSDLKRKFDRSFNEGTFYALSWLNSISSDLSYIETIRKESFDPAEIVNSDIFVIGQEIKYGEIEAEPLSNVLLPFSTGARYKSTGYKGLSNEGKKSLGISGNSVTATITTVRTADAFFGRNDKGYLAANSKLSKAHGKLDDKASNFAYVAEYNNRIREGMTAGGDKSERFNLNVAESAVYFKPFLILNANSPTYLETLKSRCSSNGLSFEEIRADNSPVEGEEPLDGEGNTGLTNMVGFRGYLNSMGIPDLHARLAKSGEMANYVVSKMGYPGDWLDFITDMRPEWMFTIKDIEDILLGEKSPSEIGLLNPSKNDVLSEWNEYQKYKNGEGSVDEEVGTARFLDETGEFSEFEQGYDDSAKNLYDELSGVYDDNIEEVEEDDNEFDLDTDEYERVYSGYSDDTYDSEGDLDDEVERFDKSTSSRSSYASHQSMQEPWEDESDYDDSYFSESQNKRFKMSERSVFDNTFNFSDGESVDSFESVVQLITKDVIAKFGGLDRITSFKERGGSLIVNGICYACNISKRCALSLPYDLRASLGSGNVADIFDYDSLKYMRRLRELSFSSTDFVYDKVSVDMGYGSRISIDLFFRDLPIQVLVIGKKKFDRKTYMNQLYNSKEDRDVFYNPRFYTRVADFTQKHVDNAFKGSWEITKRAARNRDHGIFRKSLEVTGGAALTAATGTMKLGTKVVRSGLNGVRKIKNLFNEAKKDYDRK